MLLKEELNYKIFEGCLSNFMEGPVGGARNYVPIQILIMFLFGGDPINSLPQYLKNPIMKYYPDAVVQVLGSRENLDTMKIPPLGPDYMNKISKVWESVPVEEKKKIQNIYYTLKNIIGV